VINQLRTGLNMAAGRDTRISLSDIEDRLRSLSGGAREAVAESEQSAIALGALGGVALLALTYLLGRRRGRRRASVLEIRRV
jgi:hypothetical protein